MYKVEERSYKKFPECKSEMSDLTAKIIVIITITMLGICLFLAYINTKDYDVKTTAYLSDYTVTQVKTYPVTYVTEAGQVTGYRYIRTEYHCIYTYEVDGVSYNIPYITIIEPNAEIPIYYMSSSPEKYIYGQHKVSLEELLN